MLESLSQAAADAQAKLEAASLRSEPTALIRQEQASITVLQADQRSEITNANNDIAHVNHLLDQQARWVRLVGWACSCTNCLDYTSIFEAE